MIVKYQPKPNTQVSILKCPRCNSLAFVKTFSDSSKEGVCKDCGHDFSNKEDK